MVADGLWGKAPHAEVVFGQHVFPLLAGTVHVASGIAAAMSDVLRITLRGRQTHGSQPYDGIDPIVLGAHLVTRLQTIAAREVDPREAAVITVGTFHAGLKENIIPASAEFTINMRNLNPDVREHLLAGLRRVILAEATASGAPEPEIEELYTFPLLVNDEAETARVVEVLRGVLGEAQVVEKPAVMGSEDFGALPDALGVPGVYWFFGGMPQEVIDSEEPTPSNHSPFFAPVMEPTLSAGTAAAYEVLMARLGTGAQQASA